MFKRKKSNQNFFIKFWNGDLSLPMSYWLVGTVFGIGVGLAVGLFTVLLVSGDHLTNIKGQNFGPSLLRW